ncbi:DegT/DnrJ/EryC1/StrS family aminotransferase [Candidatus Omnitrophota bacterium]
MIHFINPKEIAMPNIRHKRSILKKFSTLIDNGKYINAEYVHKFEAEFGRYCKKRYCVSVNSGTDALILSLRNLGIRPGDEVLVPSVSFMATALAPLLMGARLRFIDIDIHTYNIDYELIPTSITKKTSAIIPVHWAGRPLEQKKLKKMAKKTGLAVVEDAAPAVGAFTEEGPVGSSGNHVIFSFFPTKNLSCIGDGGTILVSKKNDYERLRLLRNFGRVARESFRIIGQNSRLDELQAMILLERLKSLDVENNKRRHLARLYDRYLDKSIIRPKTDSVSGHVYHLYVILVPSKRDRIQKALKKRGIETTAHYRIPIHKHLIKMGFSEFKKSVLKNTDAYANRCLSLPMYPSLKEEEVYTVAKEINKLI